MPAPVFGFGVGDVVAVSTLIWKLCKALKDTSGDSKRFRDIRIELLAFNGVITQLQQSIRTAIALPEEEWSVVQKTLEQTTATVEEFGTCIDTFNRAFPDRGGTQAIVDWKRRIVWSLSGEKKINNFRASMQSYSAILNLSLNSFNKFGLFLR